MDSLYYLLSGIGLLAVILAIASHHFFAGLWALGLGGRRARTARTRASDLALKPALAWDDGSELPAAHGRFTARYTRHTDA
jgi:hypothetical protein